MDHARIDDGRPVIDRYELRFHLVGVGVVLQSIDLGKPSPDSDGVVRVDFSARLGPWPAAGPVYEARVVAIGFGGSGVSAVSNPFTFPSSPPQGPPNPPAPPCTYLVSPNSRTIAGAATTSTFSVTTGSECTWTPVASDGWLTFTDGRTRTGNATVTFRATANTSTTARVGTVTVATATFVVTQSGSCGFTVSPTSQGFNAAGGTGSIAVTAAAGCAWTAVRSGSWITITSGASGNGSGTVRYRVSANSGAASRTGTITIAGQPVSILQASTTAPNAPAGLRVVVIR